MHRLGALAPVQAGRCAAVCRAVWSSTAWLGALLVRWPRSTSGKKRSAAPPPGAVTGEEHAETAYAVAASRPDPARGAASDGVLHSCQLSELPRIGVLLEAGDLAVRKVPNVRDLRIERLTGGFCGCCLVSSLNYNYIAHTEECDECHMGAACRTVALDARPGSGRGAPAPDPARDGPQRPRRRMPVDRGSGLRDCAARRFDIAPLPLPQLLAWPHVSTPRSRSLPQDVDKIRGGDQLVSRD
jgi:hypothetical protein